MNIFFTTFAKTQFMTRLLFLISRFLDGGIDTILIEYLKYLSQCPQYSVTLAISLKSDELEVFSKRLPTNLEVVYFISHPFLTAIKKKKIQRKVSSAILIMDEVFLTPIRRWKINNEIHRIAKLHDVIIDFDCQHAAFLSNINIPKIAFFHFSLKETTKEKPHRIKKIERKFQCYNHIITISDAMLEEAKQLCPTLSEKFIRIYNAVNTEDIVKRSLEKIDSPLLNYPFLLCIERLEESQKDITTLIKAYERLMANYHFDYRLYIIGKGKSEAQLKSLVEQLDLTEKVVFLGFIENPYPWIMSARMIVHSAKFEGLPTTLIEAMLLNKLIISTDCPTGPKEILANGGAGGLVPVSDPDAFAKAIAHYLTNHQLEEETLAFAKKHSQHFTLSQTMGHFVQLINNLTKR